MGDAETSTVWELLRRFSSTQSGSFASQEAISWFRRHAPDKANERTLRTHIRGASWNVGDRSQFATKEPFLTRIGHGQFRRATPEELETWRAEQGDALTAVRVPEPSVTLGEQPLVAERESHMDPEDWHTEANVQASLVTALVGEGWQIVAVANTATKEHGIDVVARREGQMIGIEVKGYPSRKYADPARAHEAKRTRPSTQASHWYSQALLAAMRLRSKEPGWSSVIVLPDFSRYRDLHAETAGSLEAAEIEVWWITRGGALRINP